MEFSRQEYWSGLPCPSSGDPPDSGIEPVSRMSMLLFSHQVVSDSLRPCELQHARFPCPSLPPWVCSKSCPLSQWCYQIILSSVTPFSSFLQSFPASGSFLANQHFASDGQSIGASASALPMNIQGWFPLGMTFFELLPVQRTLKSLLQRHSSKPSVLASLAVLALINQSKSLASILQCSAYFMVCHIHTWPPERP